MLPDYSMSPETGSELFLYDKDTAAKYDVSPRIDASFENDMVIVILKNENSDVNANIILTKRML